MGLEFSQNNDISPVQHLMFRVVFVLCVIKCGVSVFCKHSHSVLIHSLHRVPTFLENRVVDDLKK